MRALNIVHLHWGFPPVIGGVETHLCMLLPELVKKGHKVKLLTGAFQGEPEESVYENVKIFRTPLMDLNWLYKRGLMDIGKEFGYYIDEHIRKIKPDIIHAHNMHYFSKDHANVLEKVANDLRVPLILTAHNSWDDPLFLELSTHIKWAHIIAVSHFIRRELTGVGCKDSRITVIHHGIDTERFRPGIKEGITRKYPEIKGKKVIFHPARMGLGKGSDVSVKAFRLVSRVVPDAMLVLAGTKNIIDWGNTQQRDIAYILHLIDEFGLTDKVFVKMFTLKEVSWLYALSSVCIYPSTVSEPFGLTMLEALASGKPMVVTNSGGMPEIIKDNINGFVVPVRDHERLATRIISLLTDDELRNRLGNTGRCMVEKDYTKERMAEDVLRVYEKVLS